MVRSYNEGFHETSVEHSTGLTKRGLLGLIKKSTFTALIREWSNSADENRKTNLLIRYYVVKYGC